MKIKLLWKYILADMNRAFISWKFPFAIAGVFIILEFAAFESRQWHFSVLNTFHLVIYSMPFLLSLIFTTLVYGQCFCEDMEHQYIRMLVMRGNLRLYTIAKLITLMVSAVAVMALAVLLFAGVLRLQYPWINLEIGGSDYEILLQDGSFREILRRGNYILYFLLCGIQYGIFAGVMSAVAALFSLLYRDRLFVLAIPLVLRYCIQYYGSKLFENPKLDVNKIFNVSYNVWNHDGFSFLYACLIGIGLSGITGSLIYRILKRQSL